MFTKKKTITSLIILGSLAGQIAITPISAQADTNRTNNISLLQNISENVNVPYKYTTTLTMPDLTGQTPENYQFEIKLVLPTGMDYTNLHIFVGEEDITDQTGTTNYDKETNSITYKFDKVTSWDSLSKSKIKMEWKTSYSGEGGEANIDSLLATLTATSKDRANNETTTRGTLKPKDINAPIVSADKTDISYSPGSNITEEQFLTDINASVTDNYDSTVSLTSNFSSAVDLLVAGNYSVNVQATDRAGNVSNTINVKVHIANPTPVAGAEVTVNYLDSAGNKLAESDTLTGIIDSDYQSTSKKISGYSLESTPENAMGTFTDTAQTVNYIYKKDIVNSTPVVENSVTPIPVVKKSAVTKPTEKVTVPIKESVPHTSTTSSEKKTTHTSLPTTGDTNQSIFAKILGGLLILISTPLLFFKKK
ncbi:LapB repeat-containing protein [Listeria sp. FSL L7-1699]|uniref:LapB repeat-containing protein n=1 Tax=Listeria farberi TaxID=2713500 RepID=A0ABR6SPN4_9LIST|nr:MucBP domain-containing protein [Listeria farberi]MBC1376011.1 LapB repeat-containing protein [Listeria farberi]MBC1381970.1 LapB repeat-containing protein [Listeria farberi]